MLQMLGLGESELDLFYELQLAAHSIAIHCQKLAVFRDEYMNCIINTVLNFD